MSSRTERRPSLEKSLQWVLGLLVLLALVSLTGVAAWIGRQTAEQFIVSRLAHDAEALIAGLDPVSGELTRAIPPVYDQPLSGHYFVMLFEDGKPLRARSLWDQPLETAFMAPGQTKVLWRDGPRGQQLLLWAAGYEKQGRRFTVAMAEDVAPLLSALHRFLIGGIALALAVAAALLWVQKRLLRRGFRQLEDVREDVRRLTRGETGSLREDVPSEVHPLVHELNQLISAWSAHLERSRNAAGNLAHALKAPLQLILQQGADDENPAVTEQAKRMRQLIERELHRARIAGRATPARHFQPESDVADLMEALDALHQDKKLRFTTDIRAPSQLPFDQEDMLELLGNLLDNAAKWTSTSVELRLVANEYLRISVDDDGPGLPTDASEVLLERGARLDEATPGHGLGLAIVGDIVKLYGGTIGIARSDALGGARVDVRLPLNRIAP